MSEHLSIGLDSWVIQDKNYADFAAGDCVAFALEFYTPRPLIEIADQHMPTLRHLAMSRYEIEGQIAYVGPDWWVIDFGLLAFREEVPPAHAKLGNWVKGTIDVGVEPFFYFERLAKTPNAPALIYDWQVESIAIRTAPWVLEGRMQRRDLSNDGWKEINKTNAWTDDDGSGEYLLRCQRLDRPPRHRR